MPSPVRPLVDEYRAAAAHATVRCPPSCRVHCVGWVRMRSGVLPPGLLLTPTRGTSIPLLGSAGVPSAGDPAPVPTDARATRNRP
jgi:hypothetical protein